MLQRRNSIDTLYLTGEEYIYTGDMPEDIHARDSHARTLLIINQIKPRFNVTATRRRDLGGFVIRSPDYKTAAFDSEIQ